VLAPGVAIRRAVRRVLRGLAVLRRRRGGGCTGGPSRDLLVGMLADDD